jgi:hypothetical protein
LAVIVGGRREPHGPFIGQHREQRDDDRKANGIASYNCADQRVFGVEKLNTDMKKTLKAETA